MAYVDLNPVRAKITEKLEESNHTSIKKRLEYIKEVEPLDVQKHLDNSIAAISNQINQKKLPISLKDIELVEWTDKSIQYKNQISYAFAYCILITATQLATKSLVETG